MTTTDPNPPQALGDALKGFRLPPGVEPSPDPIPQGMTLEDRVELRALQARNASGWYLNHRPARYAGAGIADLDREQDPDGKVAAWLDTPSATLLLAGPVGTGKTHAAYAVANAALDRGMLTVAVAVPDLLATMRPGGDSALAARARAADLLVLDDLGAEKPSEWTGEQLSALLDARVRDERRQVVTTNSPYSELAARLGERSMSRLTGGATIVRFTGSDRRRQTW